LIKHKSIIEKKNLTVKRYIYNKHFLMKKLSLLLSEQILTESRVSQAETLMNKLFDTMDANTEKLKSDLDSEAEESKKQIRHGFTEIKEADPSGNQKYLQWAIKHYVRFYPTYNQNFFVDSIKGFHELLPYITNKDISSYSPDEISNELGLAREKKRNKELEKEAKKQVDQVYEDSRWKVIVPKSHMASCVYGAGTQWCTASKRSDEHFKNYMRKGLLFYVLDKKKADREYLYKFAIQMSGESVRMVYDGAAQLINVNMTGYDEQDNSFTLKPVLGLLPSEMVTSMEEYISSGKAGEAKKMSQEKLKKNIPFGQELLTDFWTLHEGLIDGELYAMVSNTFDDIIVFGGDEEIDSAQTDFHADGEYGGEIHIDISNDDYNTFKMFPHGIKLLSLDMTIPYTEIESLYNEYEPQGEDGVESFISILYDRYIEDDIKHYYENSH
jgi:hypothetical protein